MQFLLSRRQLQWGQSMCGVCAEVIGPHTKDPCIFHPGDTEKEISVWWPHKPYFQWERTGPILSCPAVETCPYSPSYLMLRVYTAPPHPHHHKAKGYLQREERNWERPGRQPSAPDAALVSPSPQEHTPSGRHLSVTTQVPQKSQVSWEEDWTRRSAGGRE